MSWLGGSFSSITGQISNLTKDILTEGTEETTDTGTELRIAQEKIKDLQNVVTSLNSENERLKQLNQDLEEKAESSELQINTISQQYRQVLEEKQAEIKKLKEEHNELLQHQTSTEYGQNTEYSTAHGARDDLDFSDSISMQHEINRLRKECHRLQTQYEQSLSKTDVNVATDNKHQREIDDLQKKLKETSEQLTQEKENHQHEVASLQDVYSQKTSILRKKFKDEIVQYKQKISDLEQSGDSSAEGQVKANESADYLQLEEKLKSLKHDYSQLMNDHHKVCKELKDAKNQLLDQLDSNHAQSLELLGDLREFRRHMGCEMISRRDKLLEDKQYFIQQIIDSGKQQRELTTEIQDLENEQDHVFSEADTMITELGSKEQQKSTSEIIDNIEKENLMLQKKNIELQEHIVLLEKSVQTLTKEKEKYHTEHGDKSQLSEEIQQFEAIRADLQSEKEALEGVLVEIRGQLKDKEHDLSELNTRLKKKEAESEVLMSEKSQLEDALNESQLEISQTEFVITSLTMEKEELEKALDESKQSTGDTDDNKQLLDQLAQKQQELEALSTEKNELETSMEELDAQHQEAMDQVIALRNNLSGKVEKLQGQISEMQIIKDQLLEQISQQQNQIQELTDENNKFTETVQTFQSQLHDMEESRAQLTETLQSRNEEIRSMTERLEAEANETQEHLDIEKNQLSEKFNSEKDAFNNELTTREEKIKELENKLLLLKKEADEKNELIESIKDEQNELKLQTESLQQLSKERHQLASDLEEKERIILSFERQIKEKDAMLNALDEKYNFVNEKLQQGSEAEMSDFLQRISDLQETLSEKEQLINSLKSENQDVSIEKDKLDKIINKLREEKTISDTSYKEMKEKFNNGALTINNLHMDIKELKENLSQSQSKINDKSQKIKQLREEIDSLQITLQEVQSDNDNLMQSLDSLKKNNENYVFEEIQKLESGLEDKTNELVTISDKYSLLCQEFSDFKKQIEMEITELKDTLSIKDEEISNYKEEISSHKIEVEEFKQEISILKLEFEDKVKVQKTDNLALESRVVKLQTTLDEKVQYYESCIQTLRNDGNCNETLTEENKNLLKLNVEKDKTINSLKEEIQSLKEQLIETDGLVESNSYDFIAKEHVSKQDISDLATENEVCQSKIRDQIAIIEDLQSTKERLEIDIENLTSKVKNLAAEQLAGTETIAKLREEIQTYHNVIDDQKSGIILLNEKCQGHLQSLKEKESQVTKLEGMLAVLRPTIVEKDEQIKYLGNRLERAVSLIDDSKQQLLDMVDPVPDFSLPALEYPEKGLLDQGEKPVQEEMTQECASHQESERDSHNVIEEMESLQKLIKQKDDVINELQSNNASLLTMLESKSVSSSDKTLVDVHRLENEVRNLKIEREQIMAVMNEKSREASSLKSEVHRLMNTVSAGKNAIEKLQKDMIQGPGTGDKDDMQKQALQNLSRLVRDKDLEIEALKQKNETLLAVLQDSSANGSEISTLMQDKENLARQLKVFQDERDQMVTFVNQKHEESLKYHQEVQRLNQYINSETEKHNKIEHEYSSLVPQFEDKKQALLKSQHELINYKQKYTELEVKYGEMVQKVNASDTVDVSSYNTQSEELKHSHEKLKELNESLQETEQKVAILHQQNVEYEEEISRRDAELSVMRKQIDTLTFQLQGVEGELSDLKQEHSLSEKETSEQISHLQMLKESNNRLTLELQDREFEIKSLTEKSQTLTSIVDGQKDEEGQVNKLLQENESLMTQVKELQQERHQTIMALKQRQIETQELQRECQKLKDKELKYLKELDRLRGHLLQMEEAYTKDALESEEREKDLRNRLAAAEEKVLSSTSAVQSASQQAVEQVENLQQQLYTVASQRDQAYLQLSSLQDQCQQYAVSLSNLQLVLEQFQRDKDGQVAGEVEKYQRENVKLSKSVRELSSELSIVKEKLLEAEDGLEAASRLHHQLDKCDQVIAALKEEVQIREASLKNAEVEISDLRNAKDSKVDKMIMKSMLLGYFTAPKNKQNEVLHTIGSVLNFTPDEFDKVMGGKSPVGWMSGFLKFGGGAATPPSTPKKLPYVSAADRSFSELFVKFLETESSPKQPVMKLPAEEMALDVQRHHKPVFNPFTAPRHVNHTEQSSRDEHLLMPSSPLSSSLPVFSPVSENSGPRTSSAILNDVLTSR